MGAVSVDRRGRRSQTDCRRFVTKVWLESLFQLKVGLVFMQLCFRFKANDDTSTLSDGIRHRLGFLSGHSCCRS